MWRGLAAILVALAVPAAAQDCRMALLLAFDVSRSISPADYRIQQAGLLEALAAPDIRAAFLLGDPVALAVFEWSGQGSQDMIADWRIIGSAADLDAVAADVAARGAPDLRRLTALGHALSFAHAQFGRAPPCTERVLDVSGDGRNNDGYGPAGAYRRDDWGDIRVNALAIGEHETGLVAYFAAELVRGPGAFVEVAPGQRDFPAAIRRKLLRELKAAAIGQAGPPAAAPSLWRRAPL
jgi:hypothetical protein